MPELKLPRYVCYGSKFGLATLVVSDPIFKIKRSWRFEERCTAVFFGAVFVMTVCAPDCRKDLDEYETFIKNVTNILWWGSRGGANDFCTSLATSMWSWGCHRRFGSEGEGRTAQLDYIVVPRRTSEKAFVHTDVKTWNSWDHYLIYAVLLDNEASNYLLVRKKKNEMDGMKVNE